MNPDLAKLHRYPFERLAALKQGLEPPPELEHIALSIGEPRHEPPALVKAALTGALDTLGSYPVALGIAPLRETCAGWLERRYKLPAGRVDPERMVQPVNGTREGLFAFAQAVVDRSSAPLVAMPNPFYQIYEGAALLAGAEPFFLNTPPETDFLPDLDAVPATVWKRCQLLYLCSPGNPTGAIMDETYLEQVIALADRYDFVIASDECYAEIYLDEERPPPGLLQVCERLGRTSFDRCVVFHSLSKRSNVPGLRSGFVAGDPHLMQANLAYRTYHGCAVPLHTQLASVAAWRDDEHVRRNRELYREKFARVLPILEPVLEVPQPRATFYLWPSISDDEAFARDLYARYNVTVLPGSYLARDTPAGNPGRHRVRISLVASTEECVEAARRIRDFLSTGTTT